MELIVKGMTVFILSNPVLCGSRKCQYSFLRRYYSLGRGISKAKIFKKMYEALFEFPEGRVLGKIMPSMGWCMDLFWNHKLRSGHTTEATGLHDRTLQWHCVHCLGDMSLSKEWLQLNYLHKTSWKSVA